LCQPTNQLIAPQCSYPISPHTPVLLSVRAPGPPALLYCSRWSTSSNTSYTLSNRAPAGSGGSGSDSS
jgi:hypothetical protein